jgi:hypothetical protein
MFVGTVPSISRRRHDAMLLFGDTSLWKRIYFVFDTSPISSLWLVRLEIRVSNYEISLDRSPLFLRPGLPLRDKKSQTISPTKEKTRTSTR